MKTYNARKSLEKVRVGDEPRHERAKLLLGDECPARLSHSLTDSSSTPICVGQSVLQDDLAFETADSGLDEFLDVGVLSLERERAALCRIDNVIVVWFHGVHHLDI